MPIMMNERRGQWLRCGCEDCETARRAALRVDTRQDNDTQVRADDDAWTVVPAKRPRITHGRSI
jgi:hypothetical protein